MPVFRSTIRRLGLTGLAGLVGVVLSAVLFLTPVDSGWADPCGSVLFPAKVWYHKDGQLVQMNTPPCREARMRRLPWTAGIGLVGLAATGYALRSERRQSGY